MFFLFLEKVCFNEPPRRVLVPVGSLYLCDYLFPGEAPAEALLSVRELLDLQITETDVVCDLETPAGKYVFNINAIPSIACPFRYNGNV